ncbi:MAG: hypothetical protein Aurels2KO_54950 [Aureliella sp.]
MATESQDSPTTPKLELKSIPLERIDAPVHARELDAQHIERLAVSIRKFGGLLQRIGVIAVEGRFRRIWGNHRFHACQQAGLSEIDVVVVPPDTSPADEMAFSIQENALRVDEHFEDVLARIQQHAEFAGLSLTKAAEQNGVGKSQLSKIRKLDSRLSARVKKLARENETGISILYAISQCPDESEQLQHLNAYIAGKITRDEITKAIRGDQKVASKPLVLAMTLDDMPVQLSVPASADYDQVVQILAEIKSKFQQYRKQDIALDCLPEIFARQQKP